MAIRHDQRLTNLLQIAVRRGLSSAAVDDLMRRAVEFLDTYPVLDDGAEQRWNQELDGAPHLFMSRAQTAPTTPTETTRTPEDAGVQLSTVEKLSRFRASAAVASPDAGTAAPRHRARTSPAAEVPEALRKEWAGLPAGERLTRLRTWQQEQQQRA